MPRTARRGSAHATSTVPAPHPGPHGYVWDSLFPAVRDMVRRDFGVETYTHAMFDSRWPPTLYSHENTIWSTEAKFVSLQLRTEACYREFPSRAVAADVHGILMRVASLDDTLKGKMKAWSDWARLGAYGRALISPIGSWPFAR